jgi:hypothetical protein
VLLDRSASAPAWMPDLVCCHVSVDDELAVHPAITMMSRSLQEEPYGIWKYWRTDARAVILGFLAVISAIQYFGKLSAYDSVGC